MGERGGLSDGIKIDPRSGKYVVIVQFTHDQFDPIWEYGIKRKVSKSAFIRSAVHLYGLMMSDDDYALFKKCDDGVYRKVIVEMGVVTDPDGIEIEAP